MSKRCVSGSVVFEKCMKCNGIRLFTDLTLFSRNPVLLIDPNPSRNLAGPIDRRA